MGQLNIVREQISSQWKALQQQWRASCELWNDPVQRRFEREIWQEFERVVPAALEEMQKLDALIDQARREVH